MDGWIALAEWAGWMLGIVVVLCLPSLVKTAWLAFFAWSQRAATQRQAEKEKQARIRAIVQRKA